MALYRNKVLVSGIRDYPAMTWAEYQALPVAQRPKKWICTDRDYTEIPPESGEILPVANVTQMGSKKNVIKSGHSYYINAVILVLSAGPIAANATIATLPYNLHGCYIIGRLDSDGSLLLLTADNNKLIYQFGTIPAGSIIRIGSTVMVE